MNKIEKAKKFFTKDEEENEDIEADVEVDPDELVYDEKEHQETAKSLESVTEKIKEICR